MSESVLPASDPRSPFYVGVPPVDAKPINHLVAYFKLWKHFIHALIAYLKDLVMAKEFDSNLMIQLIGSIQFPGSRDLAYKTISVIEAAKTNPPSPTAQNGAPSSSAASGNSGNSGNSRPGLPKQKSQTSYFKNQTFAHKRSNSSTSFMSDVASISAASAKAGKSLKNDLQSAPHLLSNHSIHSGGSSSSHSNQAATNTPPILAAKYAPKHDVKIDPTYFPPNSLFHNLPGALVNHHLLLYTARARMAKDVSNKLIPRLEHLHRNLSIKIKEIKSSLKNESFANPSVVKEVSKTGAVLNTFISSIRRYTDTRPILSKGSEEDEDNYESLNDPFLIKLRVDYQLKHQLVHENYVFALYVNLQNISKDLLNYVVKDLNSVADRLTRLVSAESVYASSVENGLYNLAYTLKNHINSADTEWEYFISNNPNFLNVFKSTPTNPRMVMRTLQDIVVPYLDSLHCKCLRCGIMYKKQKLLKSYTSHFYLLTCNYLHEFRLDGMSEKLDKFSEVGNKKEKKDRVQKKKKGKIGGIVGHDDTPVKSYNLNNYSLQIKSDSDFKFILTKSSNASQKFTFKCSTEGDFSAWVTDLHDLLKFNSNHLRRFAYIEERMIARDKTSASASAGPAASEVPAPATPGSSGAEAAAATPSSGSPSPVPETKPGRKDLNLSLSNLWGKHHGSSPAQKDQNGSSLPQTSLSGMFTPRLQSPSEGSKQENPFESTFSDLVPSEQRTAMSENSETRSSSESPAHPLTPSWHSESPVPARSPDSAAVLSAALSPKSPEGSIGSQVSSQDTEADAQHKEEHENYLKLQEEILRQQKKLLDLKMMPGSKSPSSKELLSRQSSSESMVSMLEQSNNDLATFLNRNKDIMEKPSSSIYTHENNSLVPAVFVLSHEND